MNQFLKKILVFFFLGLLLFPFFFFIAYYKLDLKKLIGNEVYHSILKSVSKKSGVKTLLLGDSIGKQAYDNNTHNDSIYSLACNQAISVVGQYFLLKSFLDTYESPEEINVVLVYRPSSFRNDLDQPFTFNYFLKPFYNNENKKYLTAHVKKQINEVPFFFLAELSVVKQSNWSPSYMADLNNPNDFKISKTSAEYLKKMYDLCESNNVKSFKIICPFISNQFSINDFDKFQDDIERFDLKEHFNGYFDKIVFLDKTLFIDGRHLKNPSEILKKNYLNL